MEARKEAFKQSLRSELALANAQQLINVCHLGPASLLTDVDLDTDHKRKMLRKVHHKTLIVPLDF